MQILHVKTYRRKPTKSRILLLWGSMQIADCKMLHLSEFCVCEFCSADCKSVWPAQNSRILLWVCAEQKFRDLTFCCPRIKMQKGKFNTTLADSPHHCGESPMTLTEFCCHVEADPFGIWNSAKQTSNAKTCALVSVYDHISRFPNQNSAPVWGRRILLSRFPKADLECRCQNQNSGAIWKSGEFKKY